jgi:sugar lactone lactonase YvrE
VNRFAIALLLLLAVALPASAGAGKDARFPETIPLPEGFNPEGIASTGHRDLYVGSIPTGAIWRGNARSGQGEVLVQPQEGRAAIGIKADDRGRLFVAGGPTGDAYVYDADDGSNRARYDLAPDGADTFVNDVVVTRDAAYFTDSRLQQIYVVPLGRRGRLPAQSRVRTVPLTGAIQYTTGNNANGIEYARGGRVLVIVQSNTGKLFRVNPSSGRTREIGLGGGDVTNGDGLLLDGRKLYVVQNRDNRIAVVKLDGKLRRGTLRRPITDPDFDVPTTLTVAAGFLYAVNARFGTATPQDQHFDVVRVG